MTKTLDLPKGKLIIPAKPTICVALTTYRYIEQKTVQSLFNALGMLKYQATYISHTSANVWKGRNALVEHFLKTPADYMFMLDADMEFQPEDLEALVDEMTSNPECGVIGALYVSRDTNIRPLIGWTDDSGMQVGPEESIARLLESRGKVVEVGLLPTGFMLIRRNVLETLSDPWFIVESKVDDKGELHNFSSDNVFVGKAKKAGFKVYGHFGVEVGHIGNFTYHPAQMWPTLEAWDMYAKLNTAKLSFGEKYGVNTREYWNALYLMEASLGHVREYTPLYSAITAGIASDWRVLDVASGPGVLASRIAKVAQDCECLDLSDEAVRMCQEKELSARQWDVINDQVPVDMHGEYDCVVCTEVLEHLDDPAAAIKKLYSFLKPDGLVMISVPDNRLPPEEEPEHVGVFTAAKLAKLMLPFDQVFVEPIAGYLLAVGKKPATPKKLS